MNNKEEIIKQFPASVEVKTDGNGVVKYLCPRCKREIQYGKDKCSFCCQTLSWTTALAQQAKENGYRLEGSLKFELPGDFSPGNCRKCPISYISKRGAENLYACPLQSRQENCPIAIKKIYGTP